MPLIEELPTTAATRVSHGWAYVPDTQPTKTILPPGSRKRGAAREGAANRADGSAKQAKIIQARLADLDKENYKDAAIPIPHRPKEKGSFQPQHFQSASLVADVPLGKKITPNVRRILMYQRTFAHYLADEEAQLVQSGGSNTPTVTATLGKANPPRTTTAGAGAVPGPSTRPPSRAQQSPMLPPPRPRTAPNSTLSNLKRESSTDRPASAKPGPKPRTSAAAPSQPPSSIGGAAALLPVNPTLDSDPLLKSHTPKIPSARVMDALLSEPALTYNAARAKPLEDGPPVRYFCAVCGYWGKVKCRKCGERTCGLMECWRGHEAGCSPY
jgi:zinc finger HIT domain-containing protein 1